MGNLLDLRLGSVLFDNNKCPLYLMFVIEWIKHEREMLFTHRQFVLTKIREGGTMYRESGEISHY